MMLFCILSGALEAPCSYILSAAGRVSHLWSSVMAEICYSDSRSNNSTVRLCVHYSITMLQVFLDSRSRLAASPGLMPC